MLYLAAACFAAGVAVGVQRIDYRQWALVAVTPYAVAAAASLWLHRQRLTTSTTTKLRALICATAFITAVLLPLVMQVAWQQDCSGCGHQQAEVQVIARAGTRVLSGTYTYLVGGTHPGDYFPYLPGMAAFGLPSAWRPSALTDPRIMFAVVTFAALTMAIATLQAADHRIRATQLLATAPMTALPLATGGDDLPVLALMILALVCLHRNNYIRVGMCIGAAASLKFTAWPLLVLLLLPGPGALRRQDRIKIALTAAAVALPISLPSMLHEDGRMINNVLRFPLGAAAAKSPAASPLPGHLLAAMLGAPGHLIVTALMLLTLAAYATRHLRRPRPRTTTHVAWSTATILAIATLLAPATRFGYLIYPMDLAVTAWILDLTSNSSIKLAVGNSPCPPPIATAAEAAR